MSDWTNTGYKRSLKINTTKTGDDTPPTIYTINIDGQSNFNGTIGAINNEDFAKLTSSQFNLRVNALQQYIHDTYDVSDPDLYESINWSSVRLPVNMINIAIRHQPGQPANVVYAVSDSELLETVTIIVTDGVNDYTFVLFGNNPSNNTIIDPYTISDLSIVSITPTYGNYALYTASISTFPAINIYIKATFPGSNEIYASPLSTVSETVMIELSDNNYNIYTFEVDGGDTNSQRLIGDSTIFDLSVMSTTPSVGVNADYTTIINL